MNYPTTHRHDDSLSMISRAWLAAGFFCARPHHILVGSCLSAVMALGSPVHAFVVDLTKTDISAINRTATYNLGPTGLRGWIYNSGDGGSTSGQEGTMSALSRQILVTAVGSDTPAANILGLNDVILGVGWGHDSGPVPMFKSDARKSFGWAISEAEKTENGGVLRIKRWRSHVITDVSITLPVMGSYCDTAPYNCPKSSLILANARDRLISQLMADPKFLTTSYGGAIKGLALLASVESKHPQYAAVQARLHEYSQALTALKLKPEGMYAWEWGYMGIYLSEYYMRTLADGKPDSSVLSGVNQFTTELARKQSRYGTFGHGGSGLKPDGSLHGTVPPYGPVNSAGIPANIAIVMGKQAILASHGSLNREIDPAIIRASNYFGYYVNKGPIPYGEHEPYANGHASNGKDPMCAVLFGLQPNRPVQTEYFARMSAAGYNGREYGHTGQGFSYLWGALGANMGGPAATAAFIHPVRWHLDLSRRSDGSFAYDGSEQFGAGSTRDGSYLGACGYYDINPTASYILTYALPLARIYLTGNHLNPAYILDTPKLANAIAAGSFKQACTNFPIPQLIDSLAEYDPVVRNYAVTELASRTLSEEDINTLIQLAEGKDVNQRQGACEVLGILKTTAALPVLARRLTDPDVWVRAKAGKALATFGAGASSQLTPMLVAFKANATNPEVIDWHDPVQISNGFLAEALFATSLSDSTLAASKTQLYPAVKAGLKQPDSRARNSMSDFISTKLTQADVRALLPDIFQVVASTSQADTMWYAYPRVAGINTLLKYHVHEGVQLALNLLVVPDGYGWGSEAYLIAGVNALAQYGTEARSTLPALKKYLTLWNPTSTPYKALVEAIIALEKAPAK